VRGLRERLTQAGRSGHRDLGADRHLPADDEADLQFVVEEVDVGGRMTSSYGPQTGRVGEEASSSSWWN